MLVRAIYPSIALCLSFYGISNLSASEVYQAPHPEPTAEEVAIVELMNRFRADPVTEGQLILDATDLPSYFWRQSNLVVDKQMYLEEVQALNPAPPLVFDLDALKAARLHSHYMIINDHQSHQQDPGRSGFTGRSFSDRLKAAGFSGSPGGENIFRNAGNAWQSHAAFIIDFGPGGPGGMQNGRGHRMNMINPRFNVIGASAVEHGGRFAVTHKLGRSNGRFIGGVIYSDRNGNGFFDPGEERAGALIRSSDGRSETRSWASGGYVLRLPNNSSGAVQITVGEVTTTVIIPAGENNVHFSWAVPAEAELAAADRLIREVEAIPDDARNQARRRRALISLLIGSQRLQLDHGRQERVQALTAEIASELATDQKRYLAAVAAGDRRELATVQRESSSTWRGSEAMAWFDEAALYARAAQGVAGYRATRDAGRAIDQGQLSQLHDNLRSAAQASKHPDLRAAFLALLQEVKP
ncbi:MAG: CAP domain-containing protein [Planctomycetota bacterium]|nr:MAG: CAP domain-containing protein [Planctomycetota bacterium]